MKEEERVSRRGLYTGSELLSPSRLAVDQAVRRLDEGRGSVRGAAVADDDLVDVLGEAQPVEEASEGGLLVEGWDDDRKFQDSFTV